MKMYTAAVEVRRQQYIADGARLASNRPSHRWVEKIELDEKLMRPVSTGHCGTGSGFDSLCFGLEPLAAESHKADPR